MPGLRPVSLEVSALAAAVLRSVYVPAEPAVERQISKLASFGELSTQVSEIAEAELALAARLVGATT